MAARRRRRWPWIAILGVFLAVEVALRVLTGYSTNWDVRLGADKQFDPVTQFRNKPLRDFGDGVVTNELGYRAPANLQRALPADELRILYLGDSNSVIPRHRYYPRQVEQILEAELGIPVQTVNAAVPGFSSENARLLFEHELSSFEGDYLFVNLGWNDLGQYGPEGLPFKRAEAGYAVSPLQRLFSHVYTGRLLFAALRVHERRQPAFHRPLDAAELRLYDSYEPTHFVENMTAILRRARERYPAVYVMNLATLTSDDPTESELRTAHFPVGMGKNMAKLHHLVWTYRRAIDEVARREGVPVIDLYPLFDSREARKHFTDSAHMDAEGAARVARAVADAVVARERARPSLPRRAATAGVSG